MVGANSDAWLTRKKGRPFMPYSERRFILESLRVVDRVVPFNDADGSAVDLIRKVIDLYPGAEIVFCNGGDRTAANIPEMLAKYKAEVSFKFGVGGEHKMNSSSEILERWAS